MPDTITIIDNRTGKQVDGRRSPTACSRRRRCAELDPTSGIYDPAFMSTAACASAITYLDGDAGILRYRGYPIEQLAEQSTYLEVAYLLLNGELPDHGAARRSGRTTSRTTRSSTRTCASGSWRASTTTPTRWACSSRRVAALSTFYPEAKDIYDQDSRDKQILRLIAKMPTLAALLPPLQRRPAVRLSRQHARLPRELPQHDVEGRRRYEVDPVLERALDVLFILHADHEQNCGTTAMRVVGSRHADPYSATRGRRGGALRPAATAAPTRQVVRMLTEIGSIDNVPAFIEDVKAGQGPAAWASATASTRTTTRGRRSSRRRPYEVFEVTGKNPLLDIALKLEEVALSDDYFISRKLYPNVDFYSGLIYQAMGFPIDDVHGAVRHPPHRRAGWRTGWSCSATRTRRSPGPASSTSGHRCATTCPSTRW